MRQVFKRCSTMFAETLFRFLGYYFTRLGKLCLSWKVGMDV